MLYKTICITCFFHEKTCIFLSIHDVPLLGWKPLLSLQVCGVWLHISWWLSNVVSEELCCFHIQGEDGGRKFLQNIGT
jgi:hypothetical protein